MKKSKYSEEQIATALRQVESGAHTVEITHKLRFSEQKFYLLPKTYCEMGVAEIRKLLLLEEENRICKQLVAGLTLDKVMLQDFLATKL